MAEKNANIYHRREKVEKFFKCLKLEVSSEN